MDLPAPLERAFERFKDRSIRLGRWAQAVSLRVLLVLGYVFGLGLTRLVAAMFYRRHLDLYDQGPPRETYWRDATGYDPDPARLAKQL